MEMLIMTEMKIIYVKGNNGKGKTQWMLRNIGCYPEKEFPTIMGHDRLPIEGIVTIVNIVPYPHYFSIYVYTDYLTNEEIELAKTNPRQVFEKKPSKILVMGEGLTSELYIQFFQELAKFNVKELYLSSINMDDFNLHLRKEDEYEDWNDHHYKWGKIILSPSIERLYLHIITSGELEVVDENNNPVQCHNSLQSIYGKILPALEERNKALMKQMEKYQIYTKNMENLQLQVEKIQSQILQLERKEMEKQGLLRIINDQQESLYNQYIKTIQTPIDIPKYMEVIKANPEYQKLRTQYIENYLIPYEIQKEIRVLKESVKPLERKIHRKNPYEHFGVKEMQKEINENTDMIKLWRSTLLKLGVN